VPKIAVDVIGRVRNSIRKKQREGWEDLISDIVLARVYEDALQGVEEYSHVFVLFWLSRVPQVRRGMMMVHPKFRPDLPLVGVFATRTQYRPNPIGLTLVELIGRKKNILKVRGLDALNGTPVLDIKPISPRNEFPKKSKVPDWYRRLWKGPPA
jgi:tRNA (adenine37-N6)-methyltransferase